MIGPAPTEEDIWPISLSSRIKAPNIAGSETMNENSPARERFTPPKRAPAIQQRFCNGLSELQLQHRMVERKDRAL